MENRTSRFDKALQIAIIVFGILLSGFHLYATWTGVVTVMRQRVVHVGLVILISLFVNVQKKRTSGKKISAFEAIADIAILAVAAAATI